MYRPFAESGELRRYQFDTRKKSTMLPREKVSQKGLDMRSRSILETNPELGERAGEIATAVLSELEKKYKAVDP